MDLSMIKCEVCGEGNFTLQEGFYYCDECGTQTQTVRDVQVENEFNDDEVKFQTSQKLQEEKYKHELTSWECFNYLLRGLVEEALDLGAKKELKTVTLQLWAAYLRKLEVAFFDKEKPTLPKLGPLFSKRDAKILYNRNLTRPSKRKRKKSVITNERKRLKKQRRDLAEMEYIELSSEYNTSMSYNSTSSAPTARAINLQFSKTARKVFKKVMPKEHLAMHAEDDENIMDCHDLTSKRAALMPRKIKQEQLARKTVYTILYLALNLIEDDIQLADMLRFMRDGALSTNKIAHFFPDNVAESCVRVIHSQDVNSKRQVFLESSMRAHAAFLCKLIYIPVLILPNIHKLAVRYLTELRLPGTVAVYIERLLNLCPPKMKFRLQCATTPCYEGRAMAYIIFVIKLLFGLDGVKEKAISHAAVKLNKTLEKLGQPKLFVWEQWRNYIEMRKVILAHCHSPTSVFLNEQMGASRLIDLMQNELPFIEEYATGKQNVFERVQKMFTTFNFETVKRENNEFKFPPSLTPSSSNFEVILQQSPGEVYIPDYMNEDHSVLDIESFLQPSKLKKILMEHNIQVKVRRLECNPNRNIMPLFGNYSDLERRRNRGTTIKKVNFNIAKEEWLKTIPEYKEFQVFQPPKHAKMRRTKKETKKSMMQILREKLMELLAEKIQEKIQDPSANISHNSTKATTDNLKKKMNPPSTDNSNLIAMKSKNVCSKKDVNPNKDNSNFVSMKSFDVFNEKDMNPLNASLNEPRKIPEDEDLFEEVSDDDHDDQESSSKTFSKELKFVISALDYWSLMGEVPFLPKIQYQVVRTHMPSNFLWLLDTCSQIIGIDSLDLFQEVLTIENYLIYHLDAEESVKNLVVLSEQPRNDKDLVRCKNVYKQLW